MGMDQSTWEFFQKVQRHIMQCDLAKCASLEEAKKPKPRPADARRVLQNRPEHRLQISWRAADDLQYLRRRGLLLQRFGQFLCARFNFVKQAYILDRNHSLIGKRGD